MAQYSNEIPTIYALSSAPGRAGVAVVRISGGEVLRVLDGIGCKELPPRMAVLQRLVDPIGADVIDEGLVVWFPGPGSFTGEDLAEFHVHGGRAVVSALLEALGTFGNCRMAEPGEFARRAFANGKIDLAEAEGLADLIDAETEAQRIQALRQAVGGASRIYEDWRARAIQALAMVEAAIDFSDEGDVGSRSYEAARSLTADLSAEISEHLDDGHRGEIVRDGFRVVLAGAPNVGKSSLLNALLAREAAIVSPEAGTTRDVIEARLDLDGYPVVFLDTAGLRQSQSAIEQEGMRRTREQARLADLVIWMVEAANPDFTDGDETGFGSVPVLKLVNKADLIADDTLQNSDAIAISAKTGAGLNKLVAALAERVQDRLGASGSSVISQARHRQQLVVCQDHLAAFLSGEAGDTELRAEDLRLASTALGRITGRVDVEDVLDQVFGRFCIGK